MFGLRLGKLGSAGTAPFTPARLFAASEQGAWYDPSDLTTLFQNSAGTTPVTAVEQPVGLMLDKSKGLVLGPELVANGDFSGGTTTGWSALSGGVLSVVGGQLKVENSATYGRAWQSITVTANRWYEIRTQAVAGTANTTIRFGNSGSGSSQYVNATNTTGTFVWRVFATATTIDATLYVESASIGATVFFDNISVRALPGNHAYQTSSTSRPTLRSRINLLTKTEQFDDAAWTKSSVTVSTNTDTAPDGTLTADTLAATGANGTALASFTAVATDYTFSVWLKRKTGTGNVDISAHSGGTWVTQTITSSWARYTVTQTLTAGTRTPGVRIVTSGDEVYAWGADLRVTNDGVNIPAYQRVNTETDYDTSGFPLYLDFCESFNGTNTDNSLLTNSVDFSGTDKMTVFAGVRKLSDAATAFVTEFSADLNTNNGTFFMMAPDNSATASYQFRSKGTIFAIASYTNSAIAAPTTNVLSGIGGIGNDVSTLRVNGVQTATSSTDQGTGNYGNYPLYIGRRNNTSFPFSGRLYSLIVRGASTTDAQIAATEVWINGRTKSY